MVSRLKIGNRKQGTPRLPIRKTTTIHNPAPKPVPLHLSAVALHAGTASRQIHGVAVEPSPTRQPAQLPPSEPTQHFNLSEERLLTAKEAAYRLGKSPSIIREWLHSGRLRGWQPGGHRCSLMVSEASVEEVLILPLGYRK